MNCSVLDRFSRKVAIDDESGCWQWTACDNGLGYGRFYNGEKVVYAHRWAYEHYVGPIPEGLDLDHLCRNRGCCNPAHLEAVDRRTNLLRGDTITAAHVEGRDCGYEECVSCRHLAARAARHGRAKRNPRKMVKAS